MVTGQHTEYNSVFCGVWVIIPIKQIENPQPASQATRMVYALAGRTYPTVYRVGRLGVSLVASRCPLHYPAIPGIRPVPGQELKESR